MRGCTRLAPDSPHSDGLIRDRERGTFAGVMNATRVAPLTITMCLSITYPFDVLTNIRWGRPENARVASGTRSGGPTTDLNEPTCPKRSSSASNSPRHAG
jgi:hypothetical protein